MAGRLGRPHPGHPIAFGAVRTRLVGVVNPKAMQANPQGYGTDVALLKTAGSGPFRIADFQPGQFVEFTRFDGFFEEAYLDKLRIQNVADPSARFLALKGGQAHERDQDAPAREWLRFLRGLFA